MINFSPVFYARFINQTLRKIPLRFVLIVPFVLQITATVSIISYLFFLSGQRAIEKMSSELMDEVTQRVEDHLQKLTETAETITNLTLDHWEIENIDFKNLNLPEHQLFLMIQTFKSISRISLGNEQHDFVSVTRSKEGRLLRSSPQDSSLIYDYAIDHNGKIIRLLRTFKKPSVTLAPWYQDAVKTRKTSWSDFYKIGSQEDFGFSLNTPIYHRITRELLGVFSVEIVSSDLSNFLRNIHLGQSGQVILINRQGDLVARSLGKNYQQDSEGLKKINLLSSRDLLLNHLGKFLIKNFGSLQETKTLQNVDFIIPPTMLGSLSNHYFLQVFPLKDKYGLDLIAIIVIPKSNFMAEVNTYLKQTFILSCGIFCLSIVVGILTSRWIIKPILAVNQAAKRIAEGEIQNLSDFERSDEIGELVQSFKGMNTELQTTLINLKLEILKHKKTEAKLRQAQQISKLSIWEFNYQNQTTIWTPEVYQVYGLDSTIEPPQGDEILQYIYPDDHSIYRQEVLEPLWAKKSFTAELRILRCDGSICYVEIQGEPIFDQQQQEVIRLLGTLRDITERREVEITLKNQEQLLRSIYEGVEEPIFVVEVGDNGEFYHVGTNPAHERATGFPRKLLLGKTPQELNLPSWETVVQHYQDCVNAGRSICYEEVVVLNGVERFWYTSLTPLKDLKSKIYRIVGTTLDTTYIKKTEQSLKAALEQIQQHFDNSPLAIIEWDAQGKIKRWSKHAEKIFGWKADEVIGLYNDDFCLISEEDREKVAQGIQQMISGNVSTLKIQNRNYTKTGEILVCEWFSSGLFDQQGNLTSTLSFVQDVTARQQAEEALRQSEQRFERAIKGSNDGIWDWIHVNQEQIWYSPRFFEIIGYQPNEFEPTFTRFINFIHPDDRQRVFQDIENHLRFNLPYLTEYRWLHKLGYYIWVQVRGEALRDEQGNPVSMAGSLRDITEQKVAELALRRSEAKWRHLIAANIVGILFTDFEGRIVEANDAFLQMLGYSREELETQQLNLNVMIPNYSQDVYQQMLQKILTDKVLPLHENKYLHKNGTQIPVIVGINLLEEVHQVVSFVLDLCQQKQTEFELQKAKEQAEMASRAKSTFLTNMSHELRTPLNAILGFTQLMVRDKTLASHHREKLNIINRNGEHLLELINDILSISKIEANQITLEEKIFNLYQFVEDLKDTFELRATSKGLQLMVERSPNLPQYLQTDERKLRQVLINLFDNAIKFTDQGSITLKIQPLDPIPNPVSDPSDYRIQFQVQDTGEGMAPEELETIFDAFVQTSSGQKFEQGIGLGLPISRRFVELMGGKITVHSQLGIGTGFEFTIRVQPIDSANLTYLQPQYQVTGLDPHQPQYRILVVEDSEAHRQWLTKLLRSVGFDVREASNGEEALNLVESYNPHLIWMDMRMSGMNGYQATQKIRAKKAKTLLTTPPNFSPFPKIIAVSASVFEEERQKVVAAGCDDFVGKPLTENLIWEMLKKHLGVKFRVEGSQLHKAEHHEIQDTIIVQALTTLPPELLNQLAMETQIGDSEKFLSLLAQIPPSQTFLINTLTELINNFEFELILHWVKLALS